MWIIAQSRDMHALDSCRYTHKARLGTLANTNKDEERMSRYWSSSPEQQHMISVSQLFGSSFYFTSSVSALLSTPGVFSRGLPLSEAGWGDVLFPTPRSLEVIHNILSGVWSNAKLVFHFTLKSHRSCAPSILVSHQKFVHNIWNVCTPTNVLSLLRT